MTVSPTPPAARWPAAVVAAAGVLRGAAENARPDARAALWPLLHAALFASLRGQAGRVAWARTEDLEDLASQKALELLLQAEEGSWNPEGRPDHEVAGYLARVARNALVSLARRRGRECPAPEDEGAWSEAVQDRAPAPTGPEELLATREFAVALRECAGALAPRARGAWLRRVFLERPSREIAAAIGVTPAHVDVLVQRARIALRACMEARGQRDAGLAPGAFVELWRCFAGELEEDRADDRH